MAVDNLTFPASQLDLGGDLEASGLANDQMQLLLLYSIARSLKRIAAASELSAEIEKQHGLKTGMYEVPR